MYLRAINNEEGETSHSACSGFSITLSLLRAPKNSFANHVGWARSKRVYYYSDLRVILLPGSLAAVLASSASTNATSNVVAAYKRHNDLSLFQKRSLRFLCLPFLFM